MPILPTALPGLSVLLIFSIGMLLIIFKAKLRMDKFKPSILTNYRVSLAVWCMQFEMRG